MSDRLIPRTQAATTMINQLLQLGIELVERGYSPDALTRPAIRRLCADRLRDPLQTASSDRLKAREQFLATLRAGPIALVPEKANEQHYEVPAEFFATMLGPRRKYSCCYFPEDRSTLAEAEEASLAITCERAELADGQTILELGCGWGSLSLWMAEKYPKSRITAVSNSSSQRQYIESVAASRQLSNLQIITADMNEFSPMKNGFDRVVSVEMFEHMRNYEELLRRIQGWLTQDGKLFVHIFCHRELLYPFETEGSANWMGQHFFTGGIMPNRDLLRSFDQSLRVINHWDWNGTHYQKTADEWLSNLDSNRTEAVKILKSTYGASLGLRWFHRWRMFLLAVSELFGYANGREWFVTHCLLQPVPSHQEANKVNQ